MSQQQIRLALVMTKQDAIKVALRELERDAGSWFYAAQSNNNPNLVTKHDREQMFTRAQECKEAMKILREI